MKVLVFACVKSVPYSEGESGARKPQMKKQEKVTSRNQLDEIFKDHSASPHSHIPGKNDPSLAVVFP